MVRAYFLQTHEMLFDAHFHSLSALGGMPERGIYDNMKTAMDKVRKGKDRTINKRFLAMFSHYLFEPDFCNPAAGWEKGQVEKNVRDARPRLFHSAPDFGSLAWLNSWLEQRCHALWNDIPHPEFKQQTIHDVWQEERSRLMPMPQAFDFYVAHSKRVFNLYHHAGHTFYDWRHYVPILQRKPGVLRNGASFLEMPDSFRALQKALLKRKGGDCEMTDILALILQYPEAKLEQAIADALKSGHPCKEHVINCLSRLNKETLAAPVSTPEQLTLTTEPKADTQRSALMNKNTILSTLKLPILYGMAQTVEELNQHDDRDDRDDRTVQCARKRETRRQARAHRKSPNERRLGYFRRTRLFAVQPTRRRIIVSFDQ